jgi:hypothetical protein
MKSFVHVEVIIRLFDHDSKCFPFAKLCRRLCRAVSREALTASHSLSYIRLRLFAASPKELLNGADAAANLSAIPQRIKMVILKTITLPLFYTGEEIRLQCYYNAVMLPFIMKVTIDIRCSSIAYLPMHPHGSSNKTIKHHAPLKRRFTRISLAPNKHGVNLFGIGERGDRAISIAQRHGGHNFC